MALEVGGPLRLRLEAERNDSDKGRIGETARKALINSLRRVSVSPRLRVALLTPETRHLKP